MEIEPGIELDDEVTAVLVACGQKGHRIAQAHHNDPGSNGFTFGVDRYQRSTQLVREQLGDLGFAMKRQGAGLIARRGELELQFAVARGTNLTDRAAFDADSAPGRRRAGAVNAKQLTLDGMSDEQAVWIVHIVWSGTPEKGQTAVHAGRLVSVGERRLSWAALVRLDTPISGVQEASTGARAARAYADQPEPKLHLSAKSDAAQSNEG